MEPSVTHSVSESEWADSGMHTCSQDSFRPINKFNFCSTQEEFFSSADNEQSSFKPKREPSRNDARFRSAKKKVRFADDQNTGMSQSESFGSQDDELMPFDMNATCPIDIGIDHDMSFDASPNSQSVTEADVHPKPQGISNEFHLENNTNSDSTPSGFVPNENLNFNFDFNDSINSLRQNTDVSRKENGNPNFTYILRELIVKKDDDLVSYTYQKTYNDNQMDSSVQQSVRVKDGVTPNLVLEQKEQLEDKKTGKLDFVGKRAENIGGISKNIHLSETFATKNDANFTSNSFFYDAPNMSFRRQNSAQNFSQSGNEHSPQEFDTTGYQSSQHSEFGYPFSENYIYDLNSSQNSFSSHQYDEFVPKEIPGSPYSNFYTPNHSKTYENLSPSFYSSLNDSNLSKSRFFSPQSSRDIFDQQLKSDAISPDASLEFTPILSKLERGLFLDSYDNSPLSPIPYIDSDYL